MSETYTINDSEEQHDGFTVVDEVSPLEWVNYDIQGHSHSEYIHLVVDRKEKELRCYRTSNGDDWPNERVKTTIENFSFDLRYNDDATNRAYDDSNRKQLRGFYLTWRQATSFLCFVELLENTRSNNSVRMVWYENNEKPAESESRVNHETISLEWETENGSDRAMQIADTWKATSNQMAKYGDN